VSFNVSLEDLDDLKKHLREALKEELAPLVESVVPRLNALETSQVAQGTDITSLKNNQAKALIGYTVLVSGVTLFFSHIKEFLLSLLTGNHHS